MQPFEPKLKTEIDWDERLTAEMERRFTLSRDNDDHLDWHDTQLGVEFAIEFCKKERPYEHLVKKYQALVAWYDRHFGTPCEQINHAQEIAEKDKEIAKLKERLERIDRTLSYPVSSEIHKRQWNPRTDVGSIEYAILLAQGKG